MYDSISGTPQIDTKYILTLLMGVRGRNDGMSLPLQTTMALGFIPSFINLSPGYLVNAIGTARDYKIDHNHIFVVGTLPPFISSSVDWTTYCWNNTSGPPPLCYPELG